MNIEQTGIRTISGFMFQGRVCLFIVTDTVYTFRRTSRNKVKSMMYIY